MKDVSVIISLLAMIALAACASSPGGTQIDTTGGVAAAGVGRTGIANPASTFCRQQGGQLEIRKNADGGEYGVCLLGGQEYEEWAFFRGEVGPGIEQVAVPAARLGQAKSVSALTAYLRPDASTSVVATVPVGTWVIVKGAVRKNGVIWTRIEVRITSYTSEGWVQGAPENVARKIAR